MNDDLAGFHVGFAPFNETYYTRSNSKLRGTK
jgi:hypothetical protein